MAGNAQSGWLDRVARLMAGVACALLLGGCASLIGPRQLELPLTRLQEGLERRFPLKNRIMTLLDIELSHPRLALAPDDARVSLALDVVMAPPFLSQAWRGSVLLSGRLQLDPGRNAVFLSDARVDQVQIDGSDPARERQLAGVATLVVDKLLRDVPLYRFRAEDLRYAGVQFVPSAIGMNAGALLVSVVPAP